MPTPTNSYSIKEYDEMVVEKNKKYNELLQEYTIFKNQDHLIKDIYEKDQKITNLQRIEYKKAKDYLIVLKQQLNELKEFKSVFWMKLCGCDDPNEDELNLENMSEIVCNIHNILKDIHNLTGLINVNHQFI